jgi:hypothetical protein
MKKLTEAEELDLINEAYSEGADFPSINKLFEYAYNAYYEKMLNICKYRIRIFKKSKNVSDQAKDIVMKTFLEIMSGKAFNWVINGENKWTKNYPIEVTLMIRLKWYIGDYIKQFNPAKEIPPDYTFYSYDDKEKLENYFTCHEAASTQINQTDKFILKLFASVKKTIDKTDEEENILDKRVIKTIMEMYPVQWNSFEACKKAYSRAKVNFIDAFANIANNKYGYKILTKDKLITIRNDYIDSMEKGDNPNIENYYNTNITQIMQNNYGVDKQEFLNHVVQQLKQSYDFEILERENVDRLIFLFMEVED